MTDEVMQHLALLARTLADRPPGPEPDDVLLERIMAEHPRPHRSLRWKPVIAGVSAVVVLGTGAVAAAVIRSERVQEPSTLVCRSAASRTASATRSRMAVSSRRS